MVKVTSIRPYGGSDSQILGFGIPTVLLYVITGPVGPVLQIGLQAFD
jgi:hypothetical protein